MIYTSVDVAPKTLKMPIDVCISRSNRTLMHFRSRFQIIFTLTPPTADPDKPWPAIVWKVSIIHFIWLHSLILSLSQAFHFEQSSLSAFALNVKF